MANMGLVMGSISRYCWYSDEFVLAGLKLSLSKVESTGGPS